MLQVQRNGRDWDLAEVKRAVEWAYAHAQGEDDVDSQRQLAEQVEWSPLTMLLSKAMEVLLDLEMWEGSFDAQPA